MLSPQPLPITSLSLAFQTIKLLERVVCLHCHQFLIFHSVFNLCTLASTFNSPMTLLSLSLLFTCQMYIFLVLLLMDFFAAFDTIMSFMLINYTSLVSMMPHSHASLSFRSLLPSLILILTCS